MSPPPPFDREASKLRRRAERVAQRAADATSEKTLMSVVVFSVDGVSIGIPRDSVDQVLPPPAITRLPDAPEAVAGITQIKGEVLSVVDLARYLGNRERRERRRLAVITLESGKLGLLVDEVVGLRDIMASELAGTLLGGSSDRPLSATTKDLVSILDLDRIARSERVRAVPSSLDDGQGPGNR